MTGSIRACRARLHVREMKSLPTGERVCFRTVIRAEPVGYHGVTLLEIAAQHFHVIAVVQTSRDLDGMNSAPVFDPDPGGMFAPLTARRMCDSPRMWRE